MKYPNIIEAIGNTPTVKINHLFPKAKDKKIEIWMKQERLNPGGSIKDRIAKNMIEAAEKDGLINKDTVIIEPTSGNTGIGLAMICACKGYRLKLVMPSSMSIERRKLMDFYGAELVLTPKELGMNGAIDKSKGLIANEKNSFMPSQFTNPANVKTHIMTTAKEICEDFEDNGLDYLITGVGTGGHITGCAKVFKQYFSGIKVIAVEPSDSPVLSGGNPGSHAIQGIGAGFIPEILDLNLIDGIVQVNSEDAKEFAKRCARQEGILVGISSGASLAAIEQQILEMKPGSRILTFCYDSGERYLSVPGFI